IRYPSTGLSFANKHVVVAVYIRAEARVIHRGRIEALDVAIAFALSYNLHMPQYDVYHEIVKQALVKDGWTITDDPFIIKFKGERLFADLGAEKSIAATKDTRKIVVEIKVFSGFSRITELERA